VIFYGSISVKVLVLGVMEPRNLITNFSKENDTSVFRIQPVLELVAMIFYKMVEIVYQAIECHKPGLTYLLTYFMVQSPS